MHTLTFLIFDFIVKTPFWTISTDIQVRGGVAVTNQQNFIRMRTREKKKLDVSFDDVVELMVVLAETTFKSREAI